MNKLSLNRLWWNLFSDLVICHLPSYETICEIKSKEYRSVTDTGWQCSEPKLLVSSPALMWMLSPGEVACWVGRRLHLPERAAAASCVWLYRYNTCTLPTKKTKWVLGTDSGLNMSCLWSMVTPKMQPVFHPCVCRARFLSSRWMSARPCKHPSLFP